MISCTVLGIHASFFLPCVFQKVFLEVSALSQLIEFLCKPHTSSRLVCVLDRCVSPEIV